MQSIDSTLLMVAILSSSVLSAAATQCGQILSQKLNRKYEKEDQQLHSNETETAKLQAVVEGMRYLLLDRILYLGQQHIEKGCISYSARKRLHQMHKVYHVGLDGNGDADLLMQEVDELPLDS